MANPRQVMYSVYNNVLKERLTKHTGKLHQSSLAKRKTLQIEIKHVNIVLVKWYGNKVQDRYCQVIIKRNAIYKINKCIHKMSSDTTKTVFVV